MTESEIVGQRYLLKKHFVRAIEDRLEKTPDLTFEDWLSLIWSDPANDGLDSSDMIYHGLDLSDLIWCWRKATGEA